MGAGMGRPAPNMGEAAVRAAAGKVPRPARDMSTGGRPDRATGQTGEPTAGCRSALYRKGIKSPAFIHFPMGRQKIYITELLM